MFKMSIIYFFLFTYKYNIIFNILYRSFNYTPKINNIEHDSDGKELLVSNRDILGGTDP